VLATEPSPWLPLDRERHPRAVPGEHWIVRRLRAVPLDLVDAIRDAGLEPSGPEIAPAVSALFEWAAGLIAQVPDLNHAVEAVVRHVHPLEAPPGYDVSHSEPRWRTTVFVSVPERTDIVGALRLAESIAHECMHLLLTDWESAGAFVADAETTMHSPWRGMARPAQGVLHGTFVFVCIMAFLSRIPASGLGLSGRDHVARRLGEISAELRAVDLRRLRSVLTPRGAGFLDSLSIQDGVGDGFA